MYRIFTITAAALILFSCSTSKQPAGVNQLTREERKQGWQLLFDGKTTKGWHKYGGGAVDPAWKVNDGALSLDIAQKKQLNIKGDWDMISDEEFENFHLQLEWKISKNGNSGIIFYIHEDTLLHKRPWETGMEMQVLDNEGHPDGKIIKHRCGDLYDLITGLPESVKPVGEWNQVEIRSMNGKLDLFLNGVNVVSTVLWDDNWKKMVAGSKFKQMAGFGTYKKGRIGLQDHGDNVYYRNIRIRKL